MSDNNALTTRRMRIGDYEVDAHMNIANAHKKAIILVHGIGVSSRYFFPLASELVDSNHVVIIDLPGYGKTPKPQNVLSITELASIVNRVVRILSLVSPVVLGHSMGCQIVAHAVKQAPQLYEKMILLAPTVYKNERSLPIQTLRLLQDAMYEPIKASFVIFPDYVRMGIGRYLVTCRYMLDDHIEETLSDCATPVLIVRGMNDRIVPEEWAKYLDRITPNSLLRHVNGAPHALQLKQPKRVAKMCRDFIEG